MNKFSDAMAIPNMLFNKDSESGRFRSDRFSRSNPRFRKLFRKAIKNGGFPAGLQNDGNTCFMNSVIQCLASSNEFIDYLSSYALPETEENNVEGNDDIVEKPKSSKFSLFSSLNSKNTTTMMKDAMFSNALLRLLNSLNEASGNSNPPTYTTKELLRVMKDSPNKHLFLGYNQEDAQEFYQNVMKQVEKEFTDLEKAQSADVIIPKNQEEKPDKIEASNVDESKSKYVDLQPDSIVGLANLGHLGNVYVPVSQLDPADVANEDKYMPYKLVTPVDGLQCDRIGCVNCGEMGGIRYSVTSGLALNIPMEAATRNRFALGELISEFCKPDIIDGVECNRCSLVAIKENLQERLEKMQETAGDNLHGITILSEKIQLRINEIEQVLAQKCIHDDVYKKLHTKNMVQKSRKVKQSYLSRPPSLLCIHVNRSVFDPRTYMVRKNNAKIDFPLDLDLSDYVADVNDINLDARLQFRKQDENAVRNNHDNTLKYKLKSLISHFGTHNYGHYVAFRKHKGVWWHISDETVRLSSEEEVLGSQGTFMLFYEIDNGGDAVYEKDDDDADEEGEDNEAMLAASSSSGSDTDVSNDTNDVTSDADETGSISGEAVATEQDSSQSEAQEHIANIQANL